MEERERLFLLLLLEGDVQKVWSSLLRTSEQSLELKELQRGYRNNLDI